MRTCMFERDGEYPFPEETQTSREKGRKRFLPLVEGGLPLREEGSPCLKVHIRFLSNWRGTVVFEGRGGGCPLFEGGGTVVHPGASREGMTESIIHLERIIAGENRS